MWFLLLLLLLFAAQHQPLKAQGANRIFLKDGSHPCEGYIGIFHNGELGYAGTKRSVNLEKVVCSSTHCGNPVRSSLMTTPWHVDKVWPDVECKGDELDLWSCKHPGSGVGIVRKDSLRKIECSNKINISMDGFTCAGAVQYSLDGGQTYSGYFCGDNLAMDEAVLLCKTLDCGTPQDIVKQPWIGWKGFKEKKSKTMTIKCLGIQNATHPWQCATQITPSCQNPAFVICTGHERLQLQGNRSDVCSGHLQREEQGEWKSVPWSVQNKTNLDAWCHKMYCGTSDDHRKDGDGTSLTCSDNIKVVLKDNNKPSSCYGEVYVEVNNSSHPVCSTLTKQAAQVVCSELNCGSVFSTSTRPNKQGIMDNVQCSDHESSLWHCRAKRDHHPFPCTKSTTAYVVCKDSIKVRLMDGPGKCAGRVEIEHEGRSLRVYEEGWTKTNSEIVCRQLDCGNKGNSINLEKFSQGSSEFLPMAVQCQENAKHISECIKAIQVEAPKKAVGITCEEHRVIFLKGKSCSGLVGIEQGTQTYWLSGSNSTWNQDSANAVCRQMHCGQAVQHFVTSPDNMTKPFWSESYLCSSDKESLFDCEQNEALPSDHADTIATVICSGNITVDLTNECWGNVNVCLGGDCGGVCADTWTDQKSVMLCKNLGCGESVKQATTKSKESKVIFKSMHSTNETTHLSQCNFVRSDENDNTCNQNPAYVVCSGSIKAKLSSRDKCSGNVEVQYGGNLLPVCSGALTEKVTQNVICGELKCGRAIKKIEYFGPKTSKGHAISQIQCSANDTSLAACSINLEEASCTPGGLQCSGWSKMALTVNKSCRGVPVVHSEGKISAVSFEGWTKTEGDRLCKDLECGNFKSINTTTSDCLWTTKFGCVDGKVPANIWDCEKKVYRSQESQSKKQLFIECQDEPKVTLSNQCYGEVKINGVGVCSSHWKESDSHMVCEELGCSNAIAGFHHVNKPSANEKYHHVSCEENHYTLGQCKRFMETCSGSLVSVYCVREAKFKTTERCGGQIEVNYQGKWEKVCSPIETFTQQLVCKHLEESCANYHNASKLPEQNTDQQVNLETMLSCTNDIQDIKYCLSHQSCEKTNPAVIYCDGYVAPSLKPPVDSTAPLWPKILGGGFVLVLVILIIAFLWICTVKRTNKGQNALRMSRKEVEIESGDYDDVMSKNEMEELNCGNGVTYEVDDQQVSYDDIEVSPEIPQSKAEVHDSTQTPPESDEAAPLGLEQEDEDYLVPRPVSPN